MPTFKPGDLVVVSGDYVYEVVGPRNGVLGVRRIASRCWGDDQWKPTEQVMYSFDPDGLRPFPGNPDLLRLCLEVG